MKIQNAEMEFVAFDAQDIIATSGGTRTFTLGGLFDGQAGNLSFIDSNGTFKYENVEAITVRTAFKHNTLGDLTVSKDTMFYYENNKGSEAEEVMGWDSFPNDEVTDFASRWNGVYEWIDNSFRKISQ